MATLRTGDVKTFKLDKFESHSIILGHSWCTIYSDNSFASWPNRSEAREYREVYDGDRIAKILKVTPKTVTVEITK